MEPRPQRWWWLPQAVGFAAILWVQPFWPSFVSPNEWPRVYQALAVVHRGSLAIDQEVAIWGACEDLSSAGGRLYPNKAPGLLPLLVPGATLAHWLAHGPSELRIAYLLGRILASGIPWLLASLLLGRELARRWGEAGALVAGGLVLATPWLAAGALLFSHAMAGACLLVGGLLLVRARPWSLFWGGVFLGWAAVSEYPTALVGGLWLAMGAWRDRFRFWPAVAGFFVPLVLLGAYDWVCFGSPFTLSSARELYPQFSTLSQKGLFGIQWPRLANVYLFVLSPERGLLFWAPLLLLGLWPPRRCGASWGAWMAACGLLLVLSGYLNAHGGWFPGPRYLVAVFPLLAVNTAGVLAAHWHLGGVRLAASAACLFGLPAAWLPLVTFPLSPPDFPLAPVTFHWPLLAAGTAMPMPLASALGFWPMVVLAGAAAAWLVLGRRLPVVALVVAAALWVGATARTPAPSFRQKLELSVVHDLYTATPGESWLERLRGEASTDEEELLLRRMLRERPAADPRSPGR